MSDIQHGTVPTTGADVVFMIVRRPDGRPAGYPMTAVFRGGAIEINTYRKAAKARFLLADGRVCCILPDGDRPGSGLALYGRAEPVDPYSSLAADAATGAGAPPIDVPEGVVAAAAERLAADKRMVFRIRIERVQRVGEVPDAAA